MGVAGFEPAMSLKTIDLKSIPLTALVRAQYY